MSLCLSGVTLGVVFVLINGSTEAARDDEGEVGGLSRSELAG